MVAAVDVCNKLDFTYREEAFAILAINAWELVLKAEWLADHGNRLESIYVSDERSASKRRRYKKTRSSAHMTHGVEHLLNQLFAAGKINRVVVRNLEAMIGVRDTAVHFYHRYPAISERVLELGLACVKNFVSAAKEWFGEELSRFHTYLMLLSLNPLSAVPCVQLTRDERAFLNYLGSLQPGQDDPAAAYAFAINVEGKFVRSKAAGAFAVRVTQDPNALPVRLAEEQIREQHPWDYQELNTRCRERYTDFKVNERYHSIRKRLQENPRYAHERRLDPEKPTPRKVFYAPCIMNELDRHYTEKGT